MFYGRIPPLMLALLCLSLGTALFVLGRHKHTQFLAIDVLAQTSHLKHVNSALKFWTTLALMALAVSARSLWVGVYLTLAMSALTVGVGGIRTRDYVRLLSLPVSFLMISGLALLFEITAQRTGIIGIHIFSVWLCVGAAAQARAALVMARAISAVSCLYFLSLTTPMSDLIGVLRRARCPELLTDLMYLIYRYIFILLSLYHMMRNAAASRLGFASNSAGLRTTGSLFANLLARGYRQANINFDAMESRCYDTGIRFLENRAPISVAPATAAAVLIILTLCLCLTLR